MLRKTLLFSMVLALSGSVWGQNIGDFVSVEPNSQDEIMHIPPSHRFQLLIKSGDPLTAGGTMPTWSDFTGYVPIAGSSENGYLSVNSETIPGGVTILDIFFNTVSRLWEVTASEAVDFSDLGNFLVAGTVANCSGHVTPWNTVVTCEENEIAGDLNGDGYTDWGWVIEIDPVTKTVMDYENDGQIDKVWAMGRFKHENVVVTADSTVAYEGEDNSANGFLFKYIMDTPGNLSAGDLYVLQQNGTTGTWIQIPNTTQSDQNNTVSLATNAGGTPFNRIEDVEIGPDGKVYFASTGTGRVYRFLDGDSTISDFEVYVENQTMPITHPGGVANVTFSGADNIAFDAQDNMWVTQDGANRHLWMVRPGHTNANPDIHIFMNTPAGTEPTGITFSPDGRFLFMSLQHPDGGNSTPVTDAAGATVTFGRDATIVIATADQLGPTVSAEDAVDPTGLAIGTVYEDASGKVHMQVEAAKGEKALLRMTEMLGRVTYEREVQLHPGSNEFEMDARSFPAGAYLISLDTPSGHVAKKLTKN